MKLTDKISNCEKCKSYAKMVDPVNYDDLFQDTWLDIWKYEERNPKKASEVVHHSTYFFRALRMNFLNKNKKKTILKNIDDINEKNIFSLNEPDSIPCEKFLYEWIDSKPEDELDFFYKNIINLVLQCGKVKDAIKLSNIKRSYFFIYYKTAKQKLKDDYILLTDGDPSSLDSLV